MNFKDVKAITIPESVPQETEVVVANTSKAFSSSSKQSSFTYLNYYPTSDSNLGSNSKLRIKGTITSVSGTEYDEGALIFRNSSGGTSTFSFSAGQTKSFDEVCYLTSEVSSTVWEVFTVYQYNAFGTYGNQMRVQLNKTNNNNLDIYVYNTYAQALFTLTITEVSEYQTVENPVVKITDSNGNILWQKSTKLYRQLEYIDMEGKYINTFNRPAAGFYFMNVKFDTNNPVNTSLGTYGVYIGSAGMYSNTFSRLVFLGTSTGVYQRLKTNGDTQVSTWNNLDSNTNYQFRLRTYNSNNTSGTWWYALNNLDTDTQVYGQYYNSSTYAINLSNLPYMHINAYCYNSSGTSATPQSVLVKGALRFKLYRFFVREGDDYSNIKWDYIPAQEKSTGRVGMYNIKTNSFMLIQDRNNNYVTTVTEPIADENPEWSPDA